MLSRRGKIDDPASVGHEHRRPGVAVLGIELLDCGDIGLELLQHLDDTLVDGEEAQFERRISIGAHDTAVEQAGIPAADLDDAIACTLQAGVYSDDSHASITA